MRKVRAVLKGSARDEQSHDQNYQCNQCGQNNFQIKSPHSPLVSLCPTALPIPGRNLSSSTHPSIGFHMPTLSQSRIPDTAANYVLAEANLSPVMKTLKNADDLAGRTKCSCVRQANKIGAYIRL